MTQPELGTPGLSRLVSRLAQGLGLGLDEAEVQRRVEAVDVAGESLLRLETAARAAGLRSSRVRATLASIAGQQVSLPLVALARAGQPGLIVVGAVRLRRLRRMFEILDVDGDLRLLSAPELAARLAVTQGDAVDWLAVEAALPLQGVGDAHAHLSPQQRLRALLKIEQRDLGVVVVYGVVVGLLSLATPLAVQALVSAVAFGNLLQPLLVLSLVVVLALLAGGLLRTLQLYVVEVLQRRLFVRLVADLAWRLPRVSFAERDTIDGAKLVNRFFDVITVQKATATLLLEGIVLMLEVGLGLLVLAVYSNTLLVFSVALLLTIVFVVFVLGRNGISTSIAESYAKHDVAGWLEDLVRHQTVFRSGSARRLGLARAEAFARSYLRSRTEHFRVLLRQGIAAYGLQAIASASLLGVGGALVMGGQLTLGQLVAAELILGTIVASIAKLGKQLESAYDLFAAVDKIGHLVDLPVERDDGSVVRLRPLGLAIHDLRVDLGGRPQVFGSLSVKAGEALAVLGSSGSGKSVFVEALLGLRAANQGRISVDGDDLRTLSLEAFRERVGVARDIEVFEGSVGENLRVGRDGVVSKELIEVLRVVELEDEILDRPEGLSLQLIPGGTALSSGQARRLMIARALLGRPGLIVIDGTLDSLDEEMARRILARLRRRLVDEGSTLIVMTTRLALAKTMPRLLRLGPQGLVDDVDKDGDKDGDTVRDTVRKEQP